MASFFKRLATSALQRREEVRDINIVRQEKAVEVGVERLKESEKSRIKKRKVIREKERYVLPILDFVKNQTGVSVDPSVGLAVFQSNNNDPDVARKTLVKMAKITPKLLKKVTQDVETAQDQMGDMLKTSDPMLPSMQKAEQMGQQAIRQTRSGESDVGGRFINALFGSLTGQPERNTQELIKERYISLFPSQEQGEQNYLEATQYLGQVIKGEDPSQIEPLRGDQATSAIGASELARREDKFLEKLPSKVKKAFEGEIQRDALILKSLKSAGIPLIGEIQPVTLLSMLRNKGDDSKAYKDGIDRLNKLIRNQEETEDRSRDLFNAGFTAVGSSDIEIINTAKYQIMNNLDIQGKKLPSAEIEDKIERQERRTKVDNTAKDDIKTSDFSSTDINDLTAHIAPEVRKVIRTKKQIKTQNGILIKPQYTKNRKISKTTFKVSRDDGETWQTLRSDYNDDTASKTWSITK